MNFRIAIGIVAASGLTVSMPGQAQLLGGDSVTLTGIFDERIERTRSCSINTDSAGSDSSMDLIGSRGTTIRLTRRANSKDASGNIGIAFDASGANAVYFEKDSFQVGTIARGGTLLAEGKGEMSVSITSGEFDRISPWQFKTAGKEALTELPSGYDFSTNRKKLASISSEADPEIGLMLGGQSGKTNNRGLSGGSLGELDNIFSLPAVRRGVVNLKINDVAEAGDSSAIQATLVCQPLALQPTTSPAIVTPVP